MGQPVRHALTLAVSTFEHPRVGDLTFATALSAELAAALRGLGYLDLEVPGNGSLTAADLGSRVHKALTAETADVVVVHLLSHGQVAERTGSLYVLGSDGQPDESTEVEHWLKAVEDFADRPLVLFLLDLCHAGAAARLPWQLRTADGASRAWVLAAAGPTEAAFAGRFTASTTAVLRRLAEGRLGIDPSVRHVPLSTIARAARVELARRCAADDGMEQTITGMVLDLAAEPDLPFFANPRYREDPRDRLLEAVEESVRPFLAELDPALDPAHFLGRASGRRPGMGDPSLGCFRGRAAELSGLVDWLDADGPGGMRVVTGSPGSGKSALIGIVVCAAHPVLSRPTRDLWHHVAAAPSVNDSLAAVHARQRSPRQVVESVAAQLAVPRRDAESWTAATLVSQIRGLESPPAVVIDALDESTDPRALLAEFILPLATARRMDGTPACWLLVAVRPWPEFDALLRYAAAAGEVVDLDAVPAARLYADLHDYVTDLLRSGTMYQKLAHRRARRAIADLVAAELTSPTAPRWAPFLLAGVFVHRLLERGTPVSGATVAALASTIPHTLPDLLEWDLSGFASPWARPVLAALAQARGEGMPVRIIALVAEGLAEHGSPEEEVGAVLDAMAFYLRRSVDTDGTTLFRLFHHTLSERLRAPHPDGAAVFFDRVMAWADPAAGPARWDAAELYLLRHAVQHAVDADADAVDRLLGDPEFLVHADPETLLPELHRAATPAARAATAVYLESQPRHADATPADRRQTLIVDSVRLGEPGLADRLGAAALFWVPRWARGVRGGRRHIRTVQVVEDDGGGLVLCEDGTGTLRRWDLAGGVEAGALDDGLDPVRTRSSASITDEGRQILVAGADDGTVRLWDPAGARPSGSPLTGHTGRVTAVACTRLAGVPTAVTAAGDARIRLWDLRRRKPHDGTLHTDGGRVLALDCATAGARPVAVTAGGDGSLRVWDLLRRRAAGTPLRGPGLRFRALICLRLEGRAMVATGDDDGDVQLWDLTDRRPAGPALPAGTPGIRALAFAETDGLPLLIAGGGDVLQTWNLATRQLVSRVVLPYPILALTASGGHLVATAGAEVFCWRLSASISGTERGAR